MRRAGRIVVAADGNQVIDNLASVAGLQEQAAHFVALLPRSSEKGFVGMKCGAAVFLENDCPS